MSKRSEKMMLLHDVAELMYVKKKKSKEEEGVFDKFCEYVMDEMNGKCSTCGKNFARGETISALYRACDRCTHTVGVAWD